jgi:lysophospholipase L1-like esterase
MKYFLLGSIVLLTGCGVSGNTAKPTANYQRFNPDAVQNPTVLIVGDSIVNAWCSAALLAQNPTWACQGSPAGVPMETSTEVLARFPRAISASPEAIVLEVGTWDMLADAPQIYVDPCDTTENSCANIQAMITEAANAGIQVIVCTIPPWGNGPAADEFDTEDSLADIWHEFDDIPDFNAAIMATAGAQHVDINSALVWGSQGVGDLYYEFPYIYNPQYTDDGINPNTLGGQVMTAAVQSALAAQSASIRLPVHP